MKPLTTNIQVAGVDEADIVKTDGEHIYLIANNSIFILKAYPPEEAQILSKITFNDTYPRARLKAFGRTHLF